MIPDYIKAQLQSLITHLELDVSFLVQDAGSIREIFNHIKDDLTPSLKEMIQPAAFLEANGPKFLSAQSRLAAREAQKNSAAPESQCIQEILSVKKAVDLLKESPAEINKDLAALNEERTQLLAQLKTVEHAIK
jgi:chromosome segregation ATPase